MAGITRIGDYNTGHDQCPPVSLISGSGNVFIDGKGAATVGSIYAPHGCEHHSTHSGYISGGSSTVFANGKGLGRVGDPVSCGGYVAQGSGSVFAN